MLNDKNLRAIIEGIPIRCTGSYPDIDEHFLNLRREFAGKTEACFELAKQIVCLRRKINPEIAWSRFHELLVEDILIIMSKAWIPAFSSYPYVTPSRTTERPSSVQTR